MTGPNMPRVLDMLAVSAPSEPRSGAAVCHAWQIGASSGFRSATERTVPLMHPQSAVA